MSIARGIATLAANQFNLRADSSKFLVVFDNGEYDLGGWSKVSGLQVNWEQCEYRQGATMDVWSAPGVPKYTKIAFSRAVCVNSSTVQQWLAETVRTGKTYSGAVKLLSVIGAPFLEWKLFDFYPTSWKVTELDSKAANVVVETLEIAHAGFLEPKSALGSLL